MIMEETERCGRKRYIKECKRNIIRRREGEKRRMR
jgi:hypothetical protein